jgi:hypothetical protein
MLKLPIDSQGVCTSAETQRTHSGKVLINLTRMMQCEQRCPQQHACVEIKQSPRLLSRALNNHARRDSRNRPSARQQQLHQHSLCLAATARNGPTVTYHSTEEASSSDSARSSQQEDYLSRLQEATRQQQSQSSTSFNWLNQWYPVGFVK